MKIQNARGFTLVELLVALGLITIGLIALLSGLAMATSTSEYGRQTTTAVMLAEQRMEEVKSLALRSFYQVVPGRFSDEGYNTIPNHPGFRRMVRIQQNPEGITVAIIVEVWVYYRPRTDRGLLENEQHITLTTMMTERNRE